MPPAGSVLQSLPLPRVGKELRLYSSRHKRAQQLNVCLYFEDRRIDKLWLVQGDGHARINAILERWPDDVQEADMTDLFRLACGSAATRPSGLLYDYHGH